MRVCCAAMLVIIYSIRIAAGIKRRLCDGDSCPIFRLNGTASENGMVASESGAVASESGNVASESGAVASENDASSKNDAIGIDPRPCQGPKRRIKTLFKSIKPELECLDDSAHQSLCGAYAEIEKSTGERRENHKIVQDYLNGFHTNYQLQQLMRAEHLATLMHPADNQNLPASAAFQNTAQLLFGTPMQRTIISIIYNMPIATIDEMMQFKRKCLPAYLRQLPEAYKPIMEKFIKQYTSVQRGWDAYITLEAKNAILDVCEDGGRAGLDENKGNAGMRALDENSKTDTANEEKGEHDTTPNNKRSRIINNHANYYIKYRDFSRENHTDESLLAYLQTVIAYQRKRGVNRISKIEQQHYDIVFLRLYELGKVNSTTIPSLLWPYLCGRTHLMNFQNLCSLIDSDYGEKIARDIKKVVERIVLNKEIAEHEGIYNLLRLYRVCHKLPLETFIHYASLVLKKILGTSGTRQRDAYLNLHRSLVSRVFSLYGPHPLLYSPNPSVSERKASVSKRKASTSERKATPGHTKPATHIKHGITHTHIKHGISSSIKHGISSSESENKLHFDNINKFYRLSETIPNPELRIHVNEMMLEYLKVMYAHPELPHFILSFVSTCCKAEKFDACEAFLKANSGASEDGSVVSFVSTDQIVWLLGEIMVLNNTVAHIKVAILHSLVSCGIINPANCPEIMRKIENNPVVQAPFFLAIMAYSYGYYRQNNALPVHACLMQERMQAGQQAVSVFDYAEGNEIFYSEEFYLLHAYIIHFKLFVSLDEAWMKATFPRYKRRFYHAVQCIFVGENPLRRTDSLFKISASNPCHEGLTEIKKLACSFIKNSS